MTDIFDKASQLEQKQRDLSLAHHQQQREKPLIINGVRVCLDCERQIPLVRIEAVNAVRCIECQQLQELTTKQLRGK